MLIVVAALIESNGRLLVCQRKRGSKFELLWEFPGGKKEPDETLEAALARELREELGVDAKIGPEVLRVQHRYEQMREPFEIVFFAASAAPEKIQNLEFERIEWRAPEQLPELEFLPADRDLIEGLATGRIRIPKMR
jgi:8-oxo-dGTP diphosphatase